MNLLSLGIEHLKVTTEGSFSFGANSSSVSLAATLTKSLSFTLSPVCLHMTPSSLNLLLHFFSFIQLLPSSPPPLLLPKIILFSKQHKSDVLLHEEMKRLVLPSRFVLRLFSCVVPFSSLSLDVEDLSLHVVTEEKEPLISVNLHHIHCIPEKSIHQVEIGSISIKSATRSCLSLDRIRAEMTLSSLETPTVASFSSLHETAYVHSTYLPLLSHHNAYSSFFRNSIKTPLISVTSKMPPISVVLSKELFSSLSSLLHHLTPFTSIPAFPSFFQPITYHPPFLSLIISLPSLSVELLRDSFTTSEPERPFARLQIISPSLSCSVGSQHFDMTASFTSLHLESTFCHLSPPLLLETLTGYKEEIETDSWQQAQERYHALPERMTELVTISTPSSIHFQSCPHIVPSLHHYSLLNGQSDRGLLCTEDCFVENEMVLSCSLGEVDILFDDVCVSDFVWGVLIVIESVCGEVNEGLSEVNEGLCGEMSEGLCGEKNEGFCGEKNEGLEEETTDSSYLSSDTTAWEDPAITGQFRIELSSPLLTLTCVYNQVPCQEFLLPGVFFELGFFRTLEQDFLTPSLCYCGGDCKGIYWTDLTTSHETNQACSCVYPLCVDPSRREERRTLFRPFPTFLAQISIHRFLWYF